MALQVKPASQTEFYEKVFGYQSTAVAAVKQMIEQGYKFDLSLYAVKVDTPTGKSHQLSLAIGTSTLTSGKIYGAQHEKAQNEKANILTWLQSIASGSDVVPPVQAAPKAATPAGVPLYDVLLMGVEQIEIAKTVKVLTSLLGVPMLESKKMAEKAVGGVAVYVLKQVPLTQAMDAFQKLKEAGASVMIPGEAQVAQTAVQPTASGASKPKPVDSVITLRNAQCVGQKVRGTNANSVYVTVACNPRVKVAVRILGESISIRAEWVDALEEELDKLKQSGLSMKQEYASMHLEAHGVPVGRVVGGFLMGLGLKFDDQISNMAMLEVG